MGPKSIQGSQELAKRIKLRRNELNLTIEEAAAKAGVGTKTWSRYEAGESIRKDKCRGVCKALSWHNFPENESGNNGMLNLGEYKHHEAWSQYLAKTYGIAEAASFVIGSDILLDHVEEDMQALASKPRGTHIGEIGISFLEDLLPPQFLMRYDYDFLYALRTKINSLRTTAHLGNPIIAHSVLEELTLYLIVEESRFLMESIELNDESSDEYCDNQWDQWIFDIFDDMDLLTWLYSDIYLDNDNVYHFDHWLKRQFYC